MYRVRVSVSLYLPRSSKPVVKYPTRSSAARGLYPVSSGISLIE